jgi:hypothetical protein
MLESYMSITYGEEGGILLKILKEKEMVKDFFMLLDPSIKMIR